MKSTTKILLLRRPCRDTISRLPLLTGMNVAITSQLALAQVSVRDRHKMFLQPLSRLAKQLYRAEKKSSCMVGSLSLPV